MPAPDPSSGEAIIGWNETILAAIRNGLPAPTVIARALSMIHTSMYDAWAAYDGVAHSMYSSVERPEAEHTDANKYEAISYAAYKTALELFKLPVQQDIIKNYFASLGFDPNNNSTDPGTAAGVGNLVAADTLAACLNDGSNYANGYADTTGYVPVNSPDPTSSHAPGGADFDPNRWQPLRVPTGVVKDENGKAIADPINPASYVDQKFLTPQWGDVRPFALESGDQFRPHAPAQYGDFSVYFDGTGKKTTNDAAWHEQFEEIRQMSADLTPTQKAIAEFWADGPRSETPPGHWNQIAQGFIIRDHMSLESAVKFLFTLNNALFDASIVAWDTKAAYDSIRPVSAIRFEHYGEEIEAWAGPNQGTQTILGQQWQPYQQSTFVTPAFPEYTSGHSTFSTAAAAVIENFTGSSKFFDGSTVIDEDLDKDGSLDLLGQFDIFTLKFENYSGNPIVLQWNSVYDAADEAGMSRRYGGIHIQDGDLFGRTAGLATGEQAYAKSALLFNGIDAEIIEGGQKKDELVGTSDAEVLLGFNGNDLLIGKAGDDTILGGAGQDFLQGRMGDDELSGGLGNDILHGFYGNDLLLGGLGNDTLEGHAGSDTLDGGMGKDRIYGGAGADLGIYDATAVDDSIGDFYSGGKGNNDTLLIRLTEAQFADADIRAELNAYASDMQAFTFTTLHQLSVVGWEQLKVEVNGWLVEP